MNFVKVGSKYINLERVAYIDTGDVDWDYRPRIGVVFVSAGEYPLVLHFYGQEREDILTWLTKYHGLEAHLVSPLS